MENSIYICLTKKVTDQLESKKLEQLNIDSPNLKVWHAYLKYFNHRKCVILINDLTRYSIFLYGITKKDINNLGEIFCKTLKDSLRNDGFTMDQINNYFKNKDIKLRKYYNNSITGCVMDHFTHIPMLLEYFKIDRNTKILNIKRINQRLNWIYP